MRARLNSASPAFRGARSAPGTRLGLAGPRDNLGGGSPPGRILPGETAAARRVRSREGLDAGWLQTPGLRALSHDEVRGGGTDAGSTPGLFSVSSVLPAPLSFRPRGHRAGRDPHRGQDPLLELITPKPLTNNCEDCLDGCQCRSAHHTRKSGTGTGTFSVLFKRQTS